MLAATAAEEKKAQDVSVLDIRAAFSADLGGSSKYSNANFED